MCWFTVIASYQLVAQQFTLNEAKDYALSNNLSVKNAYLDVEIAKKQSLEAKSAGLPQVSINGSFSNFINLPVQVVSANFINPNAPAGETISFRAGTNYTTTGTLQASQLLFNGSYIVGLQVAKFFITASETGVTKSQEDVVFNVTQAYQIAAVGKENLRFIDSMVLITEKLVAEQKIYVELGLLDEESIEQLEYSVLTARSSKTSARIQYENAISLLKLTMGYPMNETLEITEDAKSLLSKQSLKEATSSGLESNLSLQMLQNQKTFSEFNLKNQKYTRLPTLGAYFNHTYNAYRNEFNFFANKPWYPQTSWGLQLSVPIFSGGQKYALIEQAKIRIMKDENTIKQYEQTLKSQEVQYQNNLLGAQQILELQQQNITLASKLYNNSIVKKEIGKVNSIEVTQKYNQIVMAQTQYVSSLVEVFSAKLNLDKLYNQLLK